MTSRLFDKDLISIKDLTKKDIEAVLTESAKMLKHVENGKKLDYLQNEIMATLFYEPSTRTRLSFESAMQRLGGGVIGFSDPAVSSSMKGETLMDTIKVVSSYADIIVLRHMQEGAAAKALEFSAVPIINAGDGIGQHPTQALLDLFTIKQEKGSLKNLNIAIVGDLKNGRTVHSLAYALALFNSSISFIAPDDIQIPDTILKDLRKTHWNIEKSSDLDKALDADVIYMTRIQKERFARQEDYIKFANYYKVDNKFLQKADEDVIVMHPLPRITEISPEIDNSRNSVYFKQAAYGVPVRMAILNMILKG